MQVIQSSKFVFPIRANWRDYINLTKPQDVILILLTTLVAMLTAADGVPSFWKVILTLIGGGLAAAGAGALNSYLDRDIDSVMIRTRYRPLPLERIEPRQALRFGVTLSVLACLILLVGVNLFAAFLSLVGILLYVVAYTYWLKRRSVHNVFIAGASWAIPPLVGWVAMKGSLSFTALAMFAIVFYWTPINLWALGIVRREEFARAGIPTLPVIKGSLTTRKQLVFYSVLVVILTLLPAAIGYQNFIYAEVALLLGGILVYQTVDLFRQPSNSGAARLYRYSLAYLALIFMAMLLDKTILG